VRTLGSSFKIHNSFIDTLVLNLVPGRSTSVFVGVLFRGPSSSTHNLDYPGT
jgi:hypothetical protein